MIRLKIPTDWSDITIGQFQEVYAINKLPNSLVLEKDIKIISIVTGVEESIIGNIDINDYSTIMERLSFMLNLPNDKGLKTEFKFEGKKYNLQINVNKLKLSQYIDIEMLSKSQDEIIYNMHKILSVFMSDSKGYDTDEMLKRADVIKQHMTIDMAYPVVVFFYLNYTNLLKGMQDYLMAEANNQIAEIEEIVSKIMNPGGNGISFSKN